MHINSQIIRTSFAIEYVMIFLIGLLALVATGAAGTGILVGSSKSPGTFSEKKIEDIVVGDRVWARDEDDPAAPMRLQEVTALYRKTAYDLQTLSVADELGNVEVLHLADEHPFYFDTQSTPGRRP